MKLLRKSIPFAVSMLAASICQIAVATPAVPPSSGAYVTDKQNSWVQDRVGDRIGTVNMIMCIIGSMRGDAMVNQGPYVALIDQGKCQGRGDSSKSTSTNAGASNATDYMSTIVQSTQASQTDPLVIKAWLHDEQENGGSPQKVTIYAYVVATEGKTTTHPNGLFSMYFCGEADAAPGTCMFHGDLKSDDTGLSFYQSEDHGGGPSVTQLKLVSDPNTDTGSGNVSGTDNNTPYDYTFAYDPNNFKRRDGSNSPVCFDRLQAHGDTSTWRYGTYKADGSRLDIANPGFSVKYVNGSDTYYGFWSFWGLWLPETAMTGIAAHQGHLTHHTDAGDVEMTPISKGGKLWALTRNTSALSELKNVSMMYWSHTAFGTTDGTTPAPTDTNYELQWDGAHLNAVGYQVCDNNGCSPHPLNAAVPLVASDFTNAYVNALPVFFPSGGGNGSIAVPSGHDFQGDSVVSYRTRTVVDAGAADMGLNCVSMCPQTGTNLVNSGNHQLAANPFQDSNVWGPSLTNYSYTFHNGMLEDGSSAAADASTADKTSMGNYQWGVTSGFMVTDADLASVKCTNQGAASTSGDHYCANLMDQLGTIYQWETGPNQWNQFFGANGVSFDAPLQLTLNAAATYTNHVADAGNNISGGSETQLGKFDGNKVAMQFSGFGELQGIPGNCVDPDTNLPTQCGQSARWVPAFDMVDGTALSDGSHNYFVKYLERELRLGQVSCTGLPLTLNAVGSATEDTTVSPKAVLGTEPTPGSTKPSVIDGVLQ